MGIEEPKMEHELPPAEKNELPPANYTPEEIAELEKSRTISDAKLLTDRIAIGAEYMINKKGEKENLLVEEERQRKIADTYSKEGRFNFLRDIIDKEKIEKGGSIIIDLFPGNPYGKRNDRIDGEFIMIDNSGIKIKTTRQVMSNLVWHLKEEIVTIPNEIIADVMNGKGVGI